MVSYSPDWGDPLEDAHPYPLVGVDPASGACHLIAEDPGMVNCEPIPMQEGRTLLIRRGHRDGRQLTDAAWWIQDVQTGQERHVCDLPDENEGTMSATPSPDGRLLADRMDYEHRVRIRDLTTGAVISTSDPVPGLFDPLWSKPLAFLGDGRTLVAGTWEAQCVLLDVATGAQTGTFPGSLLAGKYPVSGDGTRIMVSRPDRDHRHDEAVHVFVHDLTTGSTTPVDLTGPGSAAIDRKRPPLPLCWDGPDDYLFVTKHGRKLAFSLLNLTSGHRDHLFTVKVPQPEIQEVHVAPMPDGYWRSLL